MSPSPALCRSRTLFALGRSQGWRGVYCDRGGVFDLMELWIDNRFLIEVLPPEGVTRYQAFNCPEVARQMFGAAL